MADDVQSIKLFHCNDRERVVKFVNDYNYLILSKHKDDENWLGDGMYFWDNYGNSIYWKKEKVKHNVPESELNIASCSLECNFSEYLCDLTDFEVEKKLQDLIEIAEKQDLLGKNKPLGDKIDFLLHDLNSKVVKGFSYYRCSPQSGLLKKSKVTNKTKAIFCVKENNADIILNRKIVQ